MANYSLVANNQFKNRSFEDMLKPLAMYTEEYDRIENAIGDLDAKASVWEGMADEQRDPVSYARYKRYADDLRNQATQLSSAGLNPVINNDLLKMRRRYASEIMPIEQAYKSLEEERALRRNNKDTSMLYALDNLSIDDFLDGKTPNLYNISGTELYSRGAAAGKAASSRIYSAGDEGSTLNGYYRKWVERYGYSKESMDAFRANAAAIPELQQAADDILLERGVYDNLGENPQALQRARQSVLNGIIDGAVYQEKVEPKRDAGVMSAAERASDARARASLQLQKDRFDYEKKTSGITINNDGTVSYDPSKDAAYQRMKRLAEEEGLEGYKLNPATGRYVKDTEQAAETKREASQEAEKGKNLLKLEHSDLAHNSGFDVTFGNDRHHYDYVGLMANSGGKWRTGAIGDDVPGHGWALFSSNNLENGWGTFSMESIDSKAKSKVRVLSPSELTSLLSNDTAFREAFYTYIESLNLPENVDPEIQLVEVPNEWDTEHKKGYAIAIRR